MKQTIPINVLGKIISGNDAGMFVTVEVSDDAGGFLIFTSHGKDTKSGFDSWVLDENSLRKYFQECRWEIDWEFDRLSLPDT
jgi:hypothetical protein